MVLQKLNPNPCRMTAANPLDDCLLRWRNNLIDLTRRNPLLALRPGPGRLLMLSAPEPKKMFSLLVVEGKSARFWYPTEEGPSQGNPKSPSSPSPREIVCADYAGTPYASRGPLVAALTNLYRRAQAAYRERGLHILHVGFGVLEWRDAEDQPLRSPLVLLPVVLHRPSMHEPFVLGPAEEDPFLNPALSVRLQQEFAFGLPGVPDDWQENSLPRYIQEVESAIAGLPGWKVEPQAFLSLFPFFKGVMHQDLTDNAERIKAHPVVMALAGAAPLPRPAPLPTEQQLDDQADQSAPRLILDADGSQRLCLQAAARGDHLVLIGPPGTGKSQTIANLIADRIAQGKKVLFVSMKMAALEVVYQRLRQVGLGDFCLELHSHKANIREVVAELKRCLELPAPVAAAPEGDPDLVKLSARRDHLNRFLQALHRRQEPMGLSVWEALAQLPAWQAAPALPLGLPLARQAEDAAGQTIITEITQTQLSDLQQLLQKSQQFWHIRPGGNFPWWGFKADKFNLQLRDEVLGLIDKTRARLDKLRSTADHFASQLQVQGPIAWLARLGEYLHGKPGPVPSSWFSLKDWSELQAELDRCADQHQRLGQARAPLTARYGPGLWSLPVGAADRLEQAWKNALPRLAPGDSDGALLLKHQQALRGWAADTLKRMPTWLVEIRTIEKWLTVPLPPGAGSTATMHGGQGGEGLLDPAPQAVKHLVRLAHLGLSDHAPEPAWLQNEEALHKAQAVIAASKPVFARRQANRQTLLKTYKESFFELDLERIARGFEGPYSGWFRFLNGNYRRDRRTIRRRTLNEEVPGTLAQDVLLGREVVLDQRHIEAESAVRAAALGRYEQGLATNLEEADKAVRVAAEARTLARELNCETLPPRLVEALASTSQPHEKVRAAVKRLSESYTAWEHATMNLQGLLPMAGLPEIGAPLEECALTAIQHFSRELQLALNALGGATDGVLTQAPKASGDLAALVADLRQAEEIRCFEATQATEEQGWRDRFGPEYQGQQTNWNALRQSLAWAKRLREHWSLQHPASSLTPTIIAQLQDQKLPGMKEFRAAQELYEKDFHLFEHRFDSPGPILDGKPLREHPVEKINVHLQQLRDRVGELADWVDWRHLPDRFNHLGLGSFWEQLQQAAIPREQVVAVFLKSFWSSWVEAVFQQDQALNQFRRADHESLLEEYRRLDQQFIAAGADRVKRQVQEPLAEAGEERALLLREADKKTQHWPLRRLFDALPILLAHLKPCLLMSPLSVSQYLPADPAKLSFDLVVFDEASQILPEDAIGAIARGRQVVVTGDNQQLPPTSFSQETLGEDMDEGEDEPPVFESILEACLAAGLPQHMLRWHYRSRHEHLIAFSNSRFYGGLLMTFPSAQSTHAGLGVRLHHVADGVYDRGGRRDNPREAEAVANLVVKQLRDFPEQSVGVIAFSYPQMEAIQDALDQRLEQQPDLERCLRGNRLKGLFVKNLETVQGDERDVIFLSVGYGRDAQGKLPLHFGPINREGGARRINVAVTRARKNLVVVSSLRARDLDGEAPGIALLREYLDFAERGPAAAHPSMDPSPPLASVHALQEDVIAELAKLGYAAIPNVGCGPYRLDLGVLDPKQAGAFLLGIQFDGPTYYQIGPARDRDRLRPDLLAQLGWRLHTIWAAEWWRNRTEEGKRLQTILQQGAMR